MNCKEIIREYLIEKGFDGLHHVGLTCCCFVCGDFMHCGNPHIKACEAGYIQPEKQAGQDVIEQTQYLPYIFLISSLSKIRKTDDALQKAEFERREKIRLEQDREPPADMAGQEPPADMAGQEPPAGQEPTNGGRF